MYFKPKLIEQIVAGQKTATQRVKKADEVAVEQDGVIVAALTAAGRVKWRVGGTYAVSPGRGKPGAWWRDFGENPAPGFDRYALSIYMPWLLAHADWREIAKRRGMQPLRVRVTRIESVRVQDMDEHVAVAEGVGSVAAYAALWDAINAGAGLRWADNPPVWRLWFEVVARTDTEDLT